MGVTRIISKQNTHHAGMLTHQNAFTEHLGFLFKCQMYCLLTSTFFFFELDVQRDNKNEISLIRSTRLDSFDSFGFGFDLDLDLDLKLFEKFNT